MKLDLGGTACYRDPVGAVNIDLDGTSMADEEDDPDPTPRVIADYAQCPFPSESFDEAFGCCFLEEHTAEQFSELFRVLKHGAIARLRGCGSVVIIEDDKIGEGLKHFAQGIIDVTMMATRAGFKVDVDDLSAWFLDTSKRKRKLTVDVGLPMFVMTKP